MAVFSLLADPHSYRPCIHDMLTDQGFRTHWMEHFRSHFDLILRLALEQYGPAAAGRVEACRRDWHEELDAIAQDLHRWGELNLLVFDVLRQQKLIAHGLPDPFEATKIRENTAMMQLYPGLIAELDAHATESPRHQLLLLVEGIFAGNIFDMGTAATAQRYSTESPDFCAVRDALEGKRPWLVDHFDAFADRILAGAGSKESSGYRKAVFFLDNAGSDCLLGVIPFVRWLARRGTSVILAANTMPALNDVTIAELRQLLKQVVAVDPVLADLLERQRIVPMDSGGVAPLIDLRHISDALNAASADADLMILEGMGRAVGSNFDAQFRVDSAKICMIKDPMIAERLGGKNFDTVLRFDRAREG